MTPSSENTPDSAFLMAFHNGLVFMQQRRSDKKWSLPGQAMQPGVGGRQSACDGAYERSGIYMNPSKIINAGWYKLSVMNNSRHSEAYFYSVVLSYKFHFCPETKLSTHGRFIDPVDLWGMLKKNEVLPGQARAVLEYLYHKKDPEWHPIPQGIPLKGGFQESYRGLRWSAAAW